MQVVAEDTSVAMGEARFEIFIVKQIICKYQKRSIGFHYRYRQRPLLLGIITSCGRKIHTTMGNLPNLNISHHNHLQQIILFVFSMR